MQCILKLFCFPDTLCRPSIEVRMQRYVHLIMSLKAKKKVAGNTITISMCQDSLFKQSDMLQASVTPD